MRAEVDDLPEAARRERAGVDANANPRTVGKKAFFWRRSADSAASGSAAATAVRCVHCGLPVPRGWVEPDGQASFCCAGCRAIYEMIRGCGLGRFYDLREATGGAAGKPANLEDGFDPAETSPLDRYGTWDDPAFLETHARRSGGLTQLDLRLEGVHCAACVWLVERLPRVVPGVVEARLSLRDRVARVRFDERQAPASRVAAGLHQLGHPPRPADGGGGRAAAALADRRDQERSMLIQLGVAGACAGNAMLLALALYAGLLDGIAHEHETFFRWISLGLAAVSLAGPGRLFFRGALGGLRAGVATLDLPIALALSVGFGAGLVNVALGRGEVFFDSITMLVFLLLVGRALQMAQQRRAAESVGLLRGLTPLACEVFRENRWQRLPVEAMAVGDRVRVPPGGRVPADGEVLRGRSSLDAAALTGESRAVSVAPGDAVTAGSVNGSGRLEILARAVGDDTRVARLLADASAGVVARPELVAFADRVAGWFTAAVMLCSLVVFAGWAWAVGIATGVDHAVALLIVACPCALGLATPLTFALAQAMAARHDLLVKDAGVFERLAAVKPDRPGWLGLDKTGTLTRGKPAVAAWWTASGEPPTAALVARLAAAEAESRHPIGRALAGLACGAELPAGRAREVPAGGVIWRDGVGTLVAGRPGFVGRFAPVEAGAAFASEATSAGRSLVFVAEGRRLLAAIALEDALRPEAPEVLKSLRAAGWRPVILSGDHPAVVAQVAESLGVPASEAEGALSPENKVDRIRALAGAGEPVAMVGDGVNDAAALASAQVGVAVSGGAEAALAVADVCTARPGLDALADLVSLSRTAVAVVHQNLAVSLAYNASAVGLAAAGVLSPWMAAILMPVSSATVLALAGGRLRRWRPGAGPAAARPSVEAPRPSANAARPGVPAQVRPVAAGGPLGRLPASGARA